MVVNRSRELRSLLNSKCTRGQSLNWGLRCIAIDLVCYTMVYHHTDFSSSIPMPSHPATSGTPVMPISEIAPLSRERSLPERVAERMLQLITSKGWEQGKRIPPERDLAVAFGVSRTVIREAVKTLEARGVLENRMGSGVYVRQTDSTIFASSLKTYVQLAGSSEIRKQLVEIRRILEI